ncbi:MFS general substrate transporter [Periconia macrospinosa]|uniref:MFS general substrate transporter n=1 Tax=Periconia macrospinosa TaxID=97972 RepID=A0A2V1DEC0_9PLEO|nr:MFS general substrate transporter [Periconia macrospinosa]
MDEPSRERSTVGKENLSGSEDSHAQNEKSAAETTKSSGEWITGIRLVLIALGTALALFVAQTEAAVTSTAIISITDDLGFPIIISRLSDIFGRKQALLTCLFVFVVFSGACGASQTMLQLIMFRWIKGIGASGIVVISSLYGFDLRPPEKWASYGAVISFSITISLAIAPIIGAAFAQVGEWRWVFLLNVPVGAATMILLFLAMPNKLPLEPAAAPLPQDPSGNTRPRYHNLSQLDIAGVFMILGASVLITASLQQVAEGAPWQSGQVLAPLILSPIFLLAFIGWQWRLTVQDKKIIPLLSWRLLTNRVFLFVLLNSFLSGAIMTVTIIQVPQRFVLTKGLTPMAAGVRLLPLATTLASASVIAVIIASKGKIPVIYVMIFAGFLATAGTVGISQTPISPGIWDPQYGFQILIGFGAGTLNIMVVLLPPYIVERKLLAVANGAIIQMRILGGALALAIVTVASSSFLRRSLLEVLNPEEVSEYLHRTETLLTFSPTQQAAVREINGKYYNLQSKILIGFAVASIISSALQWQKKQIVLKG